MVYRVRVQKQSVDSIRSIFNKSHVVLAKNSSPADGRILENVLYSRADVKQTIAKQMSLDFSSVLFCPKK
jgi:hypothetical protein